MDCGFKLPKIEVWLGVLAPVKLHLRDPQPWKVYSLLDIHGNAKTVTSYPGKHFCPRFWLPDWALPRVGHLTLSVTELYHLAM